MKKVIKATSIVEAMVIMLIVISGVVGMYSLFDRSQKLSLTTKNRIEAIQIAREGIEALTNIRNTNALLFQADMENCWNVLNYDTSCIASSGTGTDIPHNASFIIWRNSDNKWILTETWALWSYSDVNYRNTFQVNKDTNGFYTQSGGLDFRPLFTREITVVYEDTNGDSNDNENDEKIWISSIVSWWDNASEKPYIIELKTLLSNRKEDK